MIFFNGKTRLLRIYIPELIYTDLLQICMLTLKEHDHMQRIFYTYIHSKDGMTDVYIKKKHNLQPTQ